MILRPPAGQGEAQGPERGAGQPGIPGGKIP